MDQVEVDAPLPTPCRQCRDQLVQLARLQGNGELLAYCQHRAGGVLVAAVAESGVIKGWSYSAPIDRTTAAQALHRHCQIVDAVAEREQPGISLQ